MRLARYFPVFALGLALAACGHGNAPAGDAVDTQAQEATPSPQPPAPDPSAVAQANAARPLQVSDLDAYAKGMDKEIELRKEASDKATRAKVAKDQQAEVMAIVEMTSAEIESAGARAAGMDAARYAFVKHAVDRVLGSVWMSKAMGKMEGGAQMQQKVGDPYAGLEADVASALKAREGELGKLREDNMAILANAQNL